MIFQDWRYLLGLGLAPVALVTGWWALRRAESVLTFFSSRNRFHRLTVVSALLLEAAGLGLLFCALAGPEREETADELARKPLDVVVALDVSLSMGAEDVAPSRIGRARRAVRALIECLVARGGSASSDRPDGARLGVVEFAGTARVVSPLTSDFRVIDEILPTLDGRNIGAFGADLAAGIDASLQLFADSPAARDLIVVTDGEHRGDRSRFEALIDAARSSRVSISALIDATDSTGREVLTRSRTDLIDPIVQACGGKRVTTQDESFPIDSLFEDLAEGAGTTVLPPTDRSDRSLFQWFLLASLLCFLAGVGLTQWAALGPAARVPLVTATLILGSCGAGEGLDLAREGDRFFQERNFDAAAASFESALRLDPDHDGIRLNLGLAGYRRGMYAEAASCFERAARSNDRRLSLPARFCLGLCHYRSALGALETAGQAALNAAGQAALNAAAQAARCGADIFGTLALEGFRRTDSRQNEEILLGLAEEIGKTLAELEASVDNGADGERSPGDGAEQNAAQGGAEEAGGLTGRETPRRSPEGRAAVARWADDPKELSPEEIRRIYARLDELKRGRQSREAHRVRQRLEGEVDW